MRLLFLTPQLPFPATQGAAIRNSHLISGLASRHDVSLLTFAGSGHSPGHWLGTAIPSLPGQPRLAALTLVAPPQRTAGQRLATFIQGDLPDMARRLRSPSMLRALRELLQVAGYDWVIIEGIELAPLRHFLPVPFLFDDHNAEYRLQARAFRGDLGNSYRPQSAVAAAYSLVQMQRLRRYERDTCRAADAVTAVSPADRTALLQLDPDLDITVVPNGVDLTEWAPGSAAQDPEAEQLRARGPLLVFDGTMDFRPNVDAVRWFCAACWPAIRAANPTATFAIVGRNPSSAVLALAALPGVRVTGAVPDTRSWVAAADVYVVPMRIGGGVRLKLLQALAMGCAVVSTTLGAEGVELVNERDLHMVDGAQAFVRAVCTLLAHPAARERLGLAGRQAVTPYAWEKIVPRFESVLEKRHRLPLPTTSSATKPGNADRVSLIITVYNERNTIGPLLTSLRAQRRAPDEVVIVDAGSTDGTVAVLREAARDAPWPVRVEVVPGANISAGRNAAIRLARHPIIAVTDAGVRLPAGWLSSLVAPFQGTDASLVAVVSGFFAPDPQTVFERAMGATVLPVLADIKPSRFLPSSRSVAFRREAWAAVGGYPEWLDYSEDLVFDLNLRAAGFRFVFAPDAVVLFRPRKNLREFFRQYYLYARGDGKADLWRKRHAIRYLTYLAASGLVIVGRNRPIFGAFLTVAGATYCSAPYRRLFHWMAGLTPGEQLQALALVPIIRLVGDVAKMAGYPAGVLWRLRGGRRRPA